MYPFEMFTPVRPDKVGLFAGVATRVVGVENNHVVREPVFPVQYFNDGEPISREEFALRWLEAYGEGVDCRVTERVPVPSYDDKQIGAVLTRCTVCQREWFMTHPASICVACRR